MAETQEKKVYQDIDVFGEENRNGTAKEYYDEEAVRMAFTLWLTSKKGDFLRQPTYGGVFDGLLFKQMNAEKAQMIHFSIRNAINNSFFPNIKLLDLQVNPNYEQRFWEISIRYQNPFDNSVQSVTVYTKDLSNKVSNDYVEVEFTGNNLYNWCVIKAPSMSGELLLYDSNKLKYIWGKYLFTNFTATDTRFNDILTICNG